MSKGRLIRTIRKKHCLTQVELAKIMGVTQNALSAWELDQHGMAPRYAIAFQKWATRQGYKVTLEQLLSGD